MQTGNTNHDVIIVGGGIAGLATAALLARRGKRVRLFEQSRALGGRARTTEQNGFYLNLGPHALYRGGRGMEVLQELGVEPRGRVPAVSGGYAVRDGVKHTFPAGVVSLLTSSLFGLSAKLETARLLGALPKIDPRPMMHKSVSQWVDGQITHPEVRQLLLAIVRLSTYTNAPEKMSAGTAIEQVKMAIGKSVLYLDGGWQTLVEGIRRAAAEAGTVIESGVKVSSVERTTAGRVEGVRLADGRIFKTDTVVIAASPAAAAALADPAGRSSLTRWAAESEPVRAACLDLALDRLADPKATFALGIDQPFYLSVHSATARLAPEGKALIHVAKYLPPGHNDPPEQVERELERLLDLVQPGWREAVAHRRFLPDMIVMNSTVLAAHGGTGGRPGPEVEDVPGLFVTGDWVGKEGLLVDASLASASEAARVIAEGGRSSLAAAS